MGWNRIVFIFATVFFSVFTFPAFAEVITLGAGKDAFLQIGYRLQILTQISQDQAGTAGGDPTIAGDNYDLYLRRSRLTLGGQVSPLVDFYVQLDDDNRGKNFSSSTGIKTRDAWIQMNSGAGWKMMAGIFPAQFSRSRLSSPFSFVALERPMIDEMMLDSTELDGKRNRGLLVWGNLGGFQYRIAGGKGAKPQASELGKESIRYNGRVQIAFMDNEEDFIYKETYLGEKSLFTVGFGIDRQDKASTDILGRVADYSAWTADLAMEGKGESGMMSLNAAYYFYDWGNTEKRNAAGYYAQGSGWQATTSFVSLDKSSGAIQPYVRYATWNAASAAPASSQRRISLGINYLLRGNDAKVVLEMEQVTYPAEGAAYDKKDHRVYSMQWQIAF